MSPVNTWIVEELEGSEHGDESIIYKVLDVDENGDPEFMQTIAERVYTEHAALLAASPEMLEMLKICEAELSESVEMQVDREVTKRRLKLLRRVLKKARGE